MPVVTDATCKLEYPFSIADSMLCAGERGKDSCQGKIYWKDIVNFMVLWKAINVEKIITIFYLNDLEKLLKWCNLLIDDYIL